MPGIYGRPIRRMRWLPRILSWPMVLVQQCRPGCPLLFQCLAALTDRLDLLPTPTGSCQTHKRFAICQPRTAGCPQRCLRDLLSNYESCWNCTRHSL